MHLKIFLILFTSLFFLTVSADEAAAQKAFSTGRDCEKQGRFLTAADHYLESEIQADDPVQKVNALICAARAYRKARKYGAEFDCLQKLAEGHVTRINFTEVVKRQFEIGDKFFAGHRDRFISWIPFITKDNRTMEIYEKALKNAPCTTAAPEARLRLGRLYLDNDNPDKAIQCFADTIKLHPDSEEARYAALELSNTLLHKSRRGDGDSQNAKLALEAFDSFLEKHPDDPQTDWIKRSRDEVYTIMAERLYNTGKFYMDEKKYDVAQRYFATVIRDYTKTRPAAAAERMLAEIDRDYKAKGLHWTPERRAFKESAFPREESPVIRIPDSGSRWLLPIRDIKGGTIEKDKKQEVVTDDML